ncbi:MAG: DUF3987 domain-containing protein [Prevotella sp.]|nr:DUF3987 domain-containing protein [Prevotella sp.]
MAVNRIILRDGKKVCVPITKKEEYIALRDSKYNADCVEKARKGEMLKDKNGNEKSYKTRLEQFNYSLTTPQPKQPLTCPSGTLSPGGEGEVSNAGDGSFPLKGANCVGNSVGMDVDFNEAEIGKIPEVVERILAKKDEIGLLMLEKSATKGLHLVFKRKPELSQEGNLRWASETLNVPFDEAAKDITRVFFTPTSKDILFIDEKLFDRTPQPPEGERVYRHETVRGKSMAPLEQKSVSKNHPLGGQGVPEKSNLIAFDLCVKEAGLNPDALDVFGEHNWHKNLMSVLSAGLAKLMSREQAFAVVAEKLPNYSQYDDCKALINYFYDNYNTAFMPLAVREINAKAQEMARDKGKEEELDTEGYNPPEPPKKLCRIHQLITSNFDPRFKSMILLSSIPEMSAHASHYRANYISGKDVGAQDYVVVIGDSGKGKNNVTDLHNLMTEKTLQEHDRKEYEKCDANAEEREKKKNAKDCPPKYHPKLRLIETASSTSILDLQANLGENGMLLGHFSEADAFGVAGGTSTKLLSTLIRKGWSGEIHTQYYMSDCSRNVMARMCISLLVCGTVNSVVGGMLSGKNTENGLMQRFIPVVVPKAKRTFRPPICNRLTQEEKDELQGMIVQLYTKDLTLGDSTLTLDMPLTRKLIGKWFDDLEVRYNNGEITEAEADLSARVGEHMMRAAIPLVALEGKESKEMLEFIKWVGDIAYYNLCWIFGHSVQKNLEEAKEMMGSHKDLRKTAEPILDKLPNIFTIKQMSDVRVNVGQSEDCYMLLSRYVKNKKIRRMDRGVYQKI